jgi:hypothetical protein
VDRLLCTSVFFRPVDVFFKQGRLSVETRRRDTLPQDCLGIGRGLLSLHPPPLTSTTTTLSHHTTHIPLTCFFSTSARSSGLLLENTHDPVSRAEKVVVKMVVEVTEGKLTDRISMSLVRLGLCWLDLFVLFVALRIIVVVVVVGVVFCFFFNI